MIGDIGSCRQQRRHGKKTHDLKRSRILEGLVSGARWMVETYCVLGLNTNNIMYIPNLGIK